ncbi:hypothetical protein [Paraburkholderia acidisoli]|nr:hypothetical protein [Paraburkholderia acidisoli]
MPFKADPFAQAAEHVANKSWTDQIGHSSLFHSVRSAFSSQGSFVSKAASAALGTGKLFLALIPVPVVGSVVGAVVDQIDGALRGAKRTAMLDEHASTKPGTKKLSKADLAKFQIKDLTVENLDRYRWKLAHAFEELNTGMQAYNNSGQNCDDLYAFALLVEQVERRKSLLLEELGKFTAALKSVNEWVEDLEKVQFPQLHTEKESIKSYTRVQADFAVKLNKTVPAHATLINQMMAEHTNCKNWCCFKLEAKYDANTNWETVKRRAGDVSRFLAPVAQASIAVRGQDYSSDSNNSKFTS